LLDPRVVCRGDGGGKVSALPREERGAERVARLLTSFVRGPLREMRIAPVNGAAGLVLRGDDDVLSVVSLTVDNGRITALDVVRNPDKLNSVPGAE
jgi:RNA polymerase sigma-70 factor (ECF subfamily)